MTKKLFFLCISYVLLILFITNSISISVVSLLLLLFFMYKINKDKEQVKDNKMYIFKFFHLYYDEVMNGNDISIKDIYDKLEIDILEDSLLPINFDNELELLQSIKVYFGDLYFDTFYRLYVEKNLKEKRKIILAYLERCFRIEKNSIEKEIGFDKDNRNNLKILFICLLSIVLIRVVFNEYFMSYSTSILGILSLTIIAIIACMTFKNYLFVVLERKQDG